MPNVDKCVRACESALVGDVKYYSDIIYSLNENEKILIFRKLKVENIEKILLDYRGKIKKEISKRFYGGIIEPDLITLIQTSNNNKDGADLKHILPTNEVINIEVKFGSATDKQIGMNQFFEIFGIDAFARALDLNNRKKWLTIYEKNNDDQQQIDRLFKVLNESIDIFNDIIVNKGFLLSNDQQVHMESLVINNSGDIRNQKQKYLKFIFSDKDFYGTDNLKTNAGKWNVRLVKKLDRENKRVNIHLVNEVTNISIKYVLNWKNNYKHNGKSIKASLGFGSPSWNIWINVGETLI
jgi:hypothetical protein